MIDSFDAHWQRTGTIASYHCFAFPADVSTAAKVFERHLKSLSGADGVNTEFQMLKSCRPQGIQLLPVIVADGLPLADLMRMEVQQVRQYQRLFRSFEHQQAVKEEYDRLNDKKGTMAAPDCHDFPTDIEGQHYLLKQLFDAILDFSEADEQPRLLPRKSKKRKSSELDDDSNHDGDAGDGTREWVQNTYVKRIQQATDVEIHFLVWNLLHRTRDAQNGVVGIGPWTTNWKYNTYTTFTERFRDVLEICRRSKAAVVSMMTATDIFTKRIAAGPIKELGQKRQNKHTNLLRDKQNKIAIHVLSKGWVAPDAQNHLFDAGGERIDVSPPYQTATESSNELVSSENIPPAQSQSYGHGSGANTYLALDDSRIPANTPESKRKKMDSTSMSRTSGSPTRFDLAPPAPTSVAYPMNPGNIVYGAATTGVHTQTDAATEELDQSQVRLYQQGDAAGQQWGTPSGGRRE